MCYRRSLHYRFSSLRKCCLPFVRGLRRSCKFTCKAAHELAGIVFLWPLCVSSYLLPLCIFRNFRLSLRQLPYFSREHPKTKLDMSSLLLHIHLHNILWHAHHLHCFLNTHLGLLRNLKNVHTFQPTIFTLTLRRICPSLRVIFLYPDIHQGNSLSE